MTTKTITPNATLDGRDDRPGEYEPFDSISADINAVPDDVRERVWCSARARHTGQMPYNWQAWRNAELAALADASPIPSVFPHQHYTSDGEYGTPRTALAFQIIGARDEFTLYQDTAYMTNVPPNAILRRDIALGTGLFNADVWALTGSPFIVTVTDTGTTMIKPVGHAGWNRSISRRRLAEYFQPLPVWEGN